MIFRAMSGGDKKLQLAIFNLQDVERKCQSNHNKSLKTQNAHFLFLHRIAEIIWMPRMVQFINGHKIYLSLEFQTILYFYEIQTF